MSNTKKPSVKPVAPMGPGPKPGMVEKPKDFKKSISKLLNLLKPHKLFIAASLILTLVATVFSVISPRILGNMTNQIVDDYISIKVYENVSENLPSGVQLPEGTILKDIMPDDAESTLDEIPAAQRELVENLDLSQKPVFHYDILAKIGSILICLFVISALASYVSGWLLSTMIQNIIKKLRSDISGKINRLPIRYFDNHQYGDVLSRVTNDVDTIGQSLNQAISQVITSIFMLIGIIIMMLTISPLMTLIAVIIVPLSFGLIGLVTKYSQKHFKNQQERLGSINGLIEENYAGQMIVKAFSGEDRHQEQFDRINLKLKESTWKSQFLSGLMMPMMIFVSNLGYVVSAALGGWLAINGRLSIGGIQAFIQYMSQFNQPITQVAQIVNLLQSTAAATERVFDFLEEAEETPDPADSTKLAKQAVKGKVEFKNVNFGYQPGQKVIKNFSAHIKPGQQVAIVGPTGAGKTTIVNLLMRFYDIDSGKILIDGTDTRDMKRADVRKLFGMVLQDTWLVNGSIKENLSYGNLSASDKQIKKAATGAQIDHFIRSLPDGYDTIIGEDSENISVGEKQLLTIARAMLADAPMLILDEATSSVDTRTEILIQEAMEKLMHGRTSFVIAHRLSTIKNSDLILVMKKGNIIEQGTHETLLAAGGFYSKLYSSQFAE